MINACVDLHVLSTKHSPNIHVATDIHCVLQADQPGSGYRYVCDI